MKRRALLLATLAALAAAPAFATAPSTISYQGVLTDGAGNLVADGPYNLTFNLYTVASGGSSIWTEVDAGVSVVKGGFSVVLGNTTSLSSLAFDQKYYLGITVGAGPELAPRVELTASPYGMSLRLPFAGSASSGGSVLSIRNTSGGAAITADPRLDIGSSTSNGQLFLWRSGSANPTASLENNLDGGEWDLYDSSGNIHTSAYTHGPSTGWLYILGGSNSYGIGMTGSYSAPGDPWIGLFGNTNSMAFNMNGVGDASVLLPANAIDSGEILDEPGIASTHNTVRTNIASTNSAALNDMQSVTITIPSTGYIVLHADAEIQTTAGTQLTYQITETSGGPVDANNEHFLGSNTTPNLYVSVSQQRIYFKSAGTYNFYFQAYRSVAGGGAVAFGATLTAEYFPTSYGSVTTIVSDAEARGFRNAKPVVASATESSAAGRDEVDLRELEIRDAEQRAALAKTDLELARARFSASVKTGHATPVKKP
jgi:hypothetical protein